MLSVTTWEPTEYELGGSTIRFKVKRLNFLEAKAFQSVYNKVRSDIPTTIGRLWASMTLTEQRALSKRLRTALDQAGVEVPALDRKPNEKGEPTLTKEEAFIAVAAPLFDQHNIDVPIPTPDQMLKEMAEAKPTIDEINKLTEEYLRSLDPDWVAQLFRDYVREVEGLEVDGATVTTGEALLAVADRELVMAVVERVRVLSTLSGQAKKTSSLPSTSAPAARTSGESATAEPVVRADGPSPATATAIPDATGWSSPSEAAPASSLVSP